MLQTRRQLTLFITEQCGVIEQIRQKFNPVQHDLIPAHVTLCREDEIEPLNLVLANIKALNLNQSLQIQFDEAIRFENGKGVFIPAKKENEAFQQLRKLILKGIDDSPRQHLPHITLMHPRNSTCTDEIFEQIKTSHLPKMLNFNTISLIEQYHGEKWHVLAEFKL